MMHTTSKETTRSTNRRKRSIPAIPLLVGPAPGAALRVYRVTVTGENKA